MQFSSGGSIFVRKWSQFLNLITKKNNQRHKTSGFNAEELSHLHSTKMFMVHVKWPSSLLAVISYLPESFVLRGTEALSSDDLRLQEMFGWGLPLIEFKFGYETNGVPFFGDQSSQRLICGLSEKEKKTL